MEIIIQLIGYGPSVEKSSRDNFKCIEIRSLSTISYKWLQEKRELASCVSSLGTKKIILKNVKKRRRIQPRGTS